MLINQPPPELFSERPVSSEFSSGLSYRTRRIITISVLILLIGGGIMRAYGGYHFHTPGTIPLIKAEGAYKQKPDQPGGLEIPNQDVDVYKSLDGNPTTKEGDEHLLPASEVPQPLDNNLPSTATVSTATPSLTPFQAEGLTTVTQQKSTTAETAAPQPLTVSPPSPSPQETLPKTAAKTSQTSVPSNVSSPQTAAIATPSTTPIVPKQASLDSLVAQVSNKDSNSDKPSQPVLENVSTTAKTGSFVQLASSTDSQAAEKEMKKLQSQYATTLGSLQLRLVRADLGVKGIFFRVQTEPVSDDQAHEICQSLKKQNARCLVVH